MKNVIGNIEQHVCNQCNGNGFVDDIQYTITVPNSRLSKSYDKYDYFIKLNKNYNTKTVRKYGDWFDYQASEMLGHLMKPSPNYRYLQV